MRLWNTAGIKFIKFGPFAIPLKINIKKKLLDLNYKNY